MRERLAGDCDGQLPAVRKIHRRFPPRHRRLLEKDLGGWSMPRAPLANPALQRPQLARPKSTRLLLTQPLEHGQGLQPSIGIHGQPRLDLRRPDVGKRVRAGAVGARPLRFRGQASRLPASRRALAHACGRRGGRHRVLLHPLLPIPSHLRVRDHPSSADEQPRTAPTAETDRPF